MSQEEESLIVQEQQIVPEKQSEITTATSETTQPKQVEEPPLNYWQMLEQGVFDLAFQFKYLPFETLGPQGFSMMHYLATYNCLEGFKLIQGNLDIRASNGQTPLLIACNYGYLEVVKYLISRGCDVNHADAYGFNGLLYAIKNKQYALVFYLVTVSPLQIADSNGCSPVHWMAYNNDLFLLRFIKVVSLDFDLLDKQGYSPVARACHGFAHETVKHLAYKYPDMMDYAFQAGSQSLQAIVKSAQWRYKFNNLRENIGIKIPTRIITATLATLYLIFQIVAFLLSDFNDSDSFFAMLFNLSYVFYMISIVFYQIWFIFKTTNSQNDGTKIYNKRPNTLPPPAEENIQVQLPVQQQQKKQKQPQQQSIQMESVPLMGQPQQQFQPLQEEDDVEDLPELTEPSRRTVINPYQEDKTPRFLDGVNIREFLSINYKPVETFIDQMHTKPKQYFKFAERIGEYRQEVNQLIDIQDPLWYTGFTMLHMIYYLFETNRFTLIHQVDWNRICPTCLTYKQPRVSHCDTCKECVRDFHFHSAIFNKCINSTNHAFYFIYIVSVTIGINWFILYSWARHYDNTVLIVMPFQVFGLIESTFVSYLYALNLFVASYLNIFVFVEIALIIFNMTYHELMNSHRYRYLYEPIKLKSGKVYLKWKTRFPNGLLQNLLFYVVNQFRNMRLQ